MLQEIQEALKLREEHLLLNGKPLVVREVANATDVAPEDAQKADYFYYLIIACVFEGKLVEGSEPVTYEAGAPALTLADIAAIKAGSRRALLPIVKAVQRVNGLDQEAEVKN